jgi:hypothetical protein
MFHSLRYLKLRTRPSFWATIAAASPQNKSLSVLILDLPSLSTNTAGPYFDAETSYVSASSTSDRSPSEEDDGSATRSASDPSSDEDKTTKRRRAWADLILGFRSATTPPVRD